MSKGYHRLAVDQPWDNRSIGGYPMPVLNGVFAEVNEDEVLAAEGLRPSVAAADFEPGPPRMTRDQATSAGFTGNTCNECGSMQMVRNGTCEKCNSCGATTGCS